MKGKRRARVSALLAAVVGVVAAGEAWAGISFDSTTSTLTLTHDADLSDALDTPLVVTPTKVPSSGSIFPAVPYQLSNFFGIGTASSVAAGSLGQVTNSTTASIVLATGTGVTQTDPGAVLPGASSLKFNVDEWWNVTAGGFGPLANGYGSITVGGTVGALGSAEFIINLSFKNQAGTDLRTPWSVDQVWGPGTFAQTFTTSRALNLPSASLPSGSKLHITGTIEFRASNEDAPTNIQVLRNEVGGAPPTAIFKPDQGGSWFDTNNWQPADPNEPGLLPIANGVGQRASLFSSVGTTHSVLLNAPVTLGTLDLGGTGSYGIAGLGGGQFNFATLQGNAVINTSGPLGSNSIVLPINLSTSLEIHNEGTSGVFLGGNISGTGGIIKTGSGVVILNQPNSYSGMTVVSEGFFGVINTSGSATGSGPVTVAGGATLAGDGIIAGTVLAQSDAQISAGTNVPGTLTLGGLGMQWGSQLDILANGSSFGSIKLTAPSALSLSGPVKVNVIDLGALNPGDYPIVIQPGGVSPQIGENFQITSTRFYDANGRIMQTTVDFGGPALRVVQTTPWTIDGNGSWGSAANWQSGVVPDGPGAAALLGSTITAPRTVTLDAARLVNGLVFNSALRYDIAPGTGGSLTLGSPGNPGVIVVANGDHGISAPVRFGGRDEIAIVPAANQLSLTGPISITSGQTLTKSGEGTLIISGPQSHEPGSSLDMIAGALRVASNFGTPGSAGSNLSLNISGNASSTDARVILNSAQDLRNLRINFDDPGSQTLDLNSPAAPGGFNPIRIYPAGLPEVKAHIFAAIRHALHAIPDDGIIDSGLHPGSAIGVAIVDDHVLVRSTRIGDLNLDGIVTISDFIDLASNFGLTGTATWQEGDLNYDGSVTISDFIDLASNFNTSYAGDSWPISDSDAKALADFAQAHGVPEPGVMMMGLGTALLLARRRREGFTRCTPSSAGR